MQSVEAEHSARFPCMHARTRACVHACTPMQHQVHVALATTRTRSMLLGAAQQCLCLCWSHPPQTHTPVQEGPWTRAARCMWARLPARWKTGRCARCWRHAGRSRGEGRCVCCGRGCGRGHGRACVHPWPGSSAPGEPAHPQSHMHACVPQTHTHTPCARAAGSGLRTLRPRRLRALASASLQRRRECCEPSGCSTTSRCGRQWINQQQCRDDHC